MKNIYFTFCCLPVGMYINKVRTADGNVESVKLNINK